MSSMFLAYPMFLSCSMFLAYPHTSVDDIIQPRLGVLLGSQYRGSNTKGSGSLGKGGTWWCNNMKTQVDQKRQNVSESAFGRSRYKQNRNGTDMGENVYPNSINTDKTETEWNGI